MNMWVVLFQIAKATEETTTREFYLDNHINVFMVVNAEEEKRAKDLARAQVRGLFTKYLPPAAFLKTEAFQLPERGSREGVLFATKLGE